MADNDDPDGCQIWAENHGYHRVSNKEMLLIDAARLWARAKKQATKFPDVDHGAALRLLMHLAEAIDD